ncbi:hypothetical protein [Neoroseomonas oryzicola]|uniref:Uncharacterized protein n=1 Tax=Neoroseomonas oryzicola TaxID=535904 RepID=A0A9X9WIB3_9PROT|nr:hypothetical protein [Neoroseomonas oryzicola]MBR0660073.1 hypothetical protein [Neoroseomonas oryzicola]NKE18206.1 hypothetical protein [Neoroseomonas oryzicola]
MRRILILTGLGLAFWAAPAPAPLSGAAAQTQSPDQPPSSPVPRPPRSCHPPPAPPTT